MKFTVIRGNDLHRYPRIHRQMFQHRRSIFVDKLGWELNFDSDGFERDEYDELNPIYIIVEDKDGNHMASSRVMPTYERHMSSDMFGNIVDSDRFSPHLTWETTRFFVAKSANRRAAPALMWAGCEFASFMGIKYYLSTTGANLLRVFTACGWKPEVIGRSGSGDNEVCACLWEVAPERTERLRKISGLSRSQDPIDFSILTTSSFQNSVNEHRQAA